MHKSVRLSVCPAPSDAGPSVPPLPCTCGGRVHLGKELPPPRQHAAYTDQGSRWDWLDRLLVTGRVRSMSHSGRPLLPGPHSGSVSLPLQAMEAGSRVLGVFTIPSNVQTVAGLLAVQKQAWATAQTQRGADGALPAASARLFFTLFREFPSIWLVPHMSLTAGS